MLDKKSNAVLKALNKLTEGATYKVITSEEIIANLTQKSQYDAESLKQIIDFLEKQDYINIKFSEENTYCYSILPKARIYLEQISGTGKSKKTANPIIAYAYNALASFIGTFLALLVFFYISF